MFELLETNRKCLLSPPFGVPFPGGALAVLFTCQLCVEPLCCCGLCAAQAPGARFTECTGAEAVVGAGHRRGSCAFAHHGFFFPWLQLYVRGRQVELKQRCVYLVPGTAIVRGDLSCACQGWVAGVQSVLSWEWG